MGVVASAGQSKPVARDTGGEMRSQRASRAPLGHVDYVWQPLSACA